MASTSRGPLVQTLLKTYGRTYAEELRISVERNKPAVLFQLLNMSLLLSARISADNAMRAARALIDARLTTPKKMAEATWQDRVDVITWHGYKRYDERTATMLGDTAQRVLDAYGGDLRALRDEAEREVAREQQLLQQFSGIGPTGADIFLREVQVAWGEVYPHADARVLKSAAARARRDGSRSRNARAATGLREARRRPRARRSREGVRRGTRGGLSCAYGIASIRPLFTTFFSASRLLSGLRRSACSET